MASATEDRFINIYVNGEKVVNSAREISSAYRKVQNEQANMIRGSKEYIAAAKKLQELKKHIDNHRNSVNGVSKSWQQAKVMIMSVVGGNLITSAFQRIISVIPNMISAQGELSDAMADVQKTSGLTAEEVEDLSDELSKIDTRTAKSELLALAAEGGKLGKDTVKDLQKFVAEADKINVALGEDLGEGAIVQIGKLSEIFEVGMLNIGSAINSLGAQGTASEAYLVDFLARVAPIGKAVNLTAGDILGFGAVLDEAGLQAEMSGTALSDFFMKFVKDTAKFEKAAKLNKGALVDMVSSGDVKGAINLFLQSIGKVATTQEEMLGLLDEIGIDGARGSAVFLTLSQNVQKVGDKQAYANEEMLKGSSILEEFNTKNNNFGARLDKLKKDIYSIFTSKAVKNFAIGMVNTFIGMIDWMKRNVDYLKIIGKLAVSVLAGFIAWKTAVAIGNQLTKIWDVMSAKIKMAAISSQGATISFRALGSAIGSIGLSGFIGILTTVATALYSFADAADVAAERQAKLNDEVDRSKQKLDDYKESIRKETDEIKRKNNLESRKLRLEGKEDEAVALEKKTTDELIKINEEANKKMQKQAVDHQKNMLNKRKDLAEAKAELEQKERENADAYLLLHELSDEKDRVAAIEDEITAEEKKWKDKLDYAKEYSTEADNLKKEGYISELEMANENKQGVLAVESEKSRGVKKEIDYQLDEYKKLYNQLGDLKDDFDGRDASEEEKAKQAIIDKYKAIAEGIDQSISKLEEGVAGGDQKSIDQYNAFLELKSRLVFQMEDEIQAKLQEMEDEAHNESMAKLDEVLKDERQKEFDAAMDKIAIEQMVREATMSEYEKSKNATEKFYDDLISLAKQNGMDTIELEKQKQEALNKITGDRIKKAVQEFEGYYSHISSMIDSYVQYMGYKSEEELRILDEQNQRSQERVEQRNASGLLSEEEYQAEKARVQHNFQVQEAAIKTEQWRRERNAKFIDSIINTAVGVAKSIPNVPLMILSGIAGAAQSALIMAQPVPKFKYGVKRLGGSSHAEGGNDIVDRKTGRLIGNMEKNEAIIPGSAVNGNGPVIDALLESGRRGGAPINMSKLVRSVPNVNISRAISQIQKPRTSQSQKAADNSKLEKELAKMNDKMERMISAVVEQAEKEVKFYYRDQKRFEKNIERSKKLGGFS